MFSLRLLAVLAVLAAVSALPATDNPIRRPVTSITDDEVLIDDTPWFSFPLFGNLFAPIWRLLPSFGEIGPKITADDDKFQVVVNVKDYKKDDLKVKVKGDFIFVQGTHEAKHDDHDVFASQFFHTYTLPANSSGSDVTAELSSDGYLIVNAPRTEKDEKTKNTDVDRTVEIKETNTPYCKDKEVTGNKDSTTTTTQVTGDSVSEDDRKEPTTPPSEHEVTEKDNMIPHGNEVSP